MWQEMVGTGIPGGQGERGILSVVLLFIILFCFFHGVILCSWAVSQQFTCSGCMLGNLRVSPLNSGMDYRIFNANMWSFCMRIKIVYSLIQRTSFLESAQNSTLVKQRASTHLYGRDGEYLRKGLNSMLLGDFIPRHGQGSQHLQSATRQVTVPQQSVVILWCKLQLHLSFLFL